MMVSYIKSFPCWSLLPYLHTVQLFQHHQESEICRHLKILTSLSLQYIFLTMVGGKSLHLLHFVFESNETVSLSFCVGILFFWKRLRLCLIDYIQYDINIILEYDMKFLIM